MRVSGLTKSGDPHPTVSQRERVLTAGVGVPLVVLITIFAANVIFAAIIGVVSILAAEEFFSLGVKRGIGRPGRWFLAAVGGVSMSFLGGPVWVLGAAVFAAITLMTIEMLTASAEDALVRVAMGLGSILYCPLTLGFTIFMPRREVLLLFAIIWIGDSTAYYAGRALGRRPLAPTVSPKKTVEGAIAGFIGSVVAGVIGGRWLLGGMRLDLIWISAVTAVAGQCGDLAESMLKRSAGVKDSSSVLPGHGGILDRLDSLFFAAPVFYWLLVP